MNVKQAIGFLGIGIFLYLSLTSLEFIFSKMLEGALIWSEINALLTHALALFIPVGLILLLFVLSLQWIKRQLSAGQEVKAIFKTMVIAYVLVQILEMIIPSVQGFYHGQVYYNKLSIHQAQLNESSMLSQQLIYISSLLIKYLTIGLLIYRELKAVPKGSSA